MLAPSHSAGLVVNDPFHKEKAIAYLGMFVTTNS